MRRERDRRACLRRAAPGAAPYSRGRARSGATPHRRRDGCAAHALDLTVIAVGIKCEAEAVAMLDADRLRARFFGAVSPPAKPDDPFNPPSVGSIERRFEEVVVGLRSIGVTAGVGRPCSLDVAEQVVGRGCDYAQSQPGREESARTASSTWRVNTTSTAARPPALISEMARRRRLQHRGPGRGRGTQSHRLP